MVWKMSMFVARSSSNKAMVFIDIKVSNGSSMPIFFHFSCFIPFLNFARMFFLATGSSMGHCDCALLSFSTLRPIFKILPPVTAFFPRATSVGCMGREDTSARRPNGAPVSSSDHAINGSRFDFQL